MKATYWVGVKNRPPHTVFHDIETNINQKNYPLFAYCLGPYKTKQAAQRANKHINKDDTFTDPFCNNGGGR